MNAEPTYVVNTKASYLPKATIKKRLAANTDKQAH